MSLRRRLKINSIAISLAVLLMLFALVFMAVALYQHLTLYFLPDVAALLTASTFIVLALITLLVAKLMTYQDKSQQSPQSVQQSLNQVEQQLQQSLDPAVRNWIIRNPGRSLGLTVLGGIIIGSNQDARKMINQFLRRHLDQ